MKNRMWRQAFAGARDPWVLFAGTFGGGLAWATGIPVAAAGVVGVAMVATAAGFAVLRGPGAEADAPAPDPRLVPGTPQFELVRTLDGYLADLTKLRSQKLPGVVTDPAIEALVAATGARESAVRTAAALDALDAALGRASSVNARWSGSGSRTEIAGSMSRMTQRRDGLLAKLDSAVGEVAEVYTKLLEVAATVDATDLSGDGVGEVEGVNASLDSLRTAFAALAVDARPGATGEAAADMLIAEDDDNGY